MNTFKCPACGALLMEGAIHLLRFNNEERNELIGTLAGRLRRLVVVQADVAPDPPDLCSVHGVSF